MNQSSSLDRHTTNPVIHDSWHSPFPADNSRPTGQSGSHTTKQGDTRPGPDSSEDRHGLQRRVSGKNATTLFIYRFPIPISTITHSKTHQRTIRRVEVDVKVKIKLYTTDPHHHYMGFGNGVCELLGEEIAIYRALALMVPFVRLSDPARYCFWTHWIRPDAFKEVGGRSTAHEAPADEDTHSDWGDWNDWGDTHPLEANPPIETETPRALEREDDQAGGSNSNLWSPWSFTPSPFPRPVLTGKVDHPGSPSPSRSPATPWLGPCPPQHERSPQQSRRILEALNFQPASCTHRLRVTLKTLVPEYYDEVSRTTFTRVEQSLFGSTTPIDDPPPATLLPIAQTPPNTSSNRPSPPSSDLSSCDSTPILKETLELPLTDPNSPRLCVTLGTLVPEYYDEALRTICTQAEECIFESTTPIDNLPPATYIPIAETLTNTSSNKPSPPSSDLSSCPSTPVVKKTLDLPLSAQTAQYLSQREFLIIREIIFETQAFCRLSLVQNETLRFLAVGTSDQVSLAIKLISKKINQLLSSE